MGYHRFITGPYFDSEIDTSRCSATRNADFCLIVKAEFFPYEPIPNPKTIPFTYSNGTPGSYRVQNWPPGELRAFREEFKRLVEFYFNGPNSNGQLYMVPSRQWGFDYQNPNRR